MGKDLFQTLGPNAVTAANELRERQAYLKSLMPPAASAPEAGSSDQPIEGKLPQSLPISTLTPVANSGEPIANSGEQSISKLPDYSTAGSEPIGKLQSEPMTGLSRTEPGLSKLTPATLAPEDGVSSLILKCLRCEHQWVPRKMIVPKLCPACKSAKWSESRINRQGMRKRQIGFANCSAMDLYPAKTERD